MIRLQDYFDYYDQVIKTDRPVLLCPHREQSLSLSQALQQVGKSEVYRKLVERIAVARHQSQLAKTPILGVVGQLNVGKSSLVASFLSQNGRRRIPRGLDENSGTHRFVYWLPRSWNDDHQLREVIFKVLRDAHGHEPEWLAENAQQAARQYYSGRNDPQCIPIPLVAFDASLQQFGFLDSLDIQSEDYPGEYMCNRRLDFVGQAARVCSAFLVLWDWSTLRDRLLRQLLEQLRRVMPEAEIYLLVNKVRPLTSCELRSVFEERNIQEVMSRYKLAGVYVAFDFDIGG